MELLQLRYFLDSAQSENFSKTAEKFMVPASSVSISVKRLEKEIGCSLFDRKGNRIVLNYQGRKLRDTLKKSLWEIDNTVAEISSFPREETGDIYLLIRSERRVITEHIIEFKKHFPNVVFHLTHDFNTKDIEKYDIIVDESSDAYQNFERFPLLKENIRFAASVNNPLCSEKITINQLYDQPFITMGEGSSLKRLTVESCEKAGFKPNIIIESDDPYYLRKYIEMDFGISLIPETSWKGEISEKIAFLDVVDFSKQRITYAYFNRLKGKNGTAERFYKFILEKESIIKRL